MESRLRMSRSCELIIIVAILGYFTVSPRLMNIPLCPSAYFGGVLCPTCGITRATWHLLHGHVSDAWNFNPIGFLVLLILARRLVVLSLYNHVISRWLQSENVDRILFATFLLFGLIRSFRMVLAAN